MTSRRDFLRSFGAAAMTVPAIRPDGYERILSATSSVGSKTPEELAADEEFWFEIQQAFTTDRSLVNLNNGGVSPTPAHVLEAMKRDLDFANQLPVYNGWQILEPQREGVRARLARQWDVDPEEVAITDASPVRRSRAADRHDLRCLGDR